MWVQTLVFIALSGASEKVAEPVKNVTKVLEVSLGLKSSQSERKARTACLRGFEPVVV